MFTDTNVDPLTLLADPFPRVYVKRGPTKRGASNMSSEWENFKKSTVEDDDFPDFKFSVFSAEKSSQSSSVQAECFSGSFSPEQSAAALSSKTFTISASDSNGISLSQNSNPYDFDEEDQLNKDVKSKCTIGSSTSQRIVNGLKIAHKTPKDDGAFQKSQRPPSKHSRNPTSTVSHKRPCPTSNVPDKTKKPCSPDKLAKPSTSRSVDLANTEFVPAPPQKSCSTGDAPKGAVGVAQHTRNATECIDGGEADDLKNEITFLLENLDARKNNTVTRCLSAMTLAGKLVNPVFRMHFFAHSSIGIFDLMNDANLDPNLSLSVAVLVLVLSTDKLKTDLDDKGLRLIGSILKDPVKGKVDPRVFDKAMTVVEKSRFAGELSRNSITAPRLVIEALMIMKLGNQLGWFIDEVRSQGYLDYFVSHFVFLYSQLEKEQSRVNLNACLRCVDFLFKLTHDSKANSDYIVSGPGSEGFVTLMKLTRLVLSSLKTDTCPPIIPLKKADLLRSCLTWLLNLTCHAGDSRSRIGSENHLMNVLSQCCFETLTDIPHERSQEILIRALLCLVNLTFDCASNCALFVDVVPSGTGSQKPSLLALAELMKRVSDAAFSSAADLDRCTEQYAKMIKQVGKDLDATIADVLDKAGENMEHFAVICYIGVLMGQLVSVDEGARASLHLHLTTVFGSCQEGIHVATEAIRRVIDFVADAKVERIYPVQEMYAAAEALEAYRFKQDSSSQ